MVRTSFLHVILLSDYSTNESALTQTMCFYPHLIIWRANAEIWTQACDRFEKNVVIASADLKSAMTVLNSLSNILKGCIVLVSSLARATHLRPCSCSQLLPVLSVASIFRLCPPLVPWDLVSNRSSPTNQPVSNSQYHTFLVFDTLVDTPAMGALKVALIFKLWT